MAYSRGANAPPHCEPDASDRASRSDPTAATERAFRARLAATGIYKAKGDHGGPMPTGRATAPLVLGPGKSSVTNYSRFKPMKT